MDEMSWRLNEKLSNLRSVNVNLRASEDYFETRPVYQEMKKKYFGREKFKEVHKKELSRYYRSERILKENLDVNGKIPEGQWKKDAENLSEEVAILRWEKDKIGAALRKYEIIRKNVDDMLSEEEESIHLSETKKRESFTETKENVRTMKPKKRSHGMEL